MIELPNGLFITLSVVNLDKDKFDDPPYQEFHIEALGETLIFTDELSARKKMQELSELSDPNPPLVFSA